MRLRVVCLRLHVWMHFDVLWVHGMMGVVMVVVMVEIVVVVVVVVVVVEKKDKNSNT